jgi:hypothetical protein
LPSQGPQYSPAGAPVKTSFPPESIPQSSPPEARAGTQGHTLAAQPRGSRGDRDPERDAGAGGTIAVAVSTPACVSVVLKSAQKNQSKFNVTATAAGSCTLTVTENGTGNVPVPVTVRGIALLPAKIAVGTFHTVDWT